MNDSFDYSINPPEPVRKRHKYNVHGYVMSLSKDQY